MVYSFGASSEWLEYIIMFYSYLICIFISCDDSFYQSYEADDMTSFLVYSLDIALAIMLANVLAVIYAEWNRLHKYFHKFWPTIVFFFSRKFVLLFIFFSQFYVNQLTAERNFHFRENKRNQKLSRKK